MQVPVHLVLQHGRKRETRMLSSIRCTASKRQNYQQENYARPASQKSCLELFLGSGHSQQYTFCGYDVALSEGNSMEGNLLEAMISMD